MANELHTLSIGGTNYSIRPKSFQWTDNTIISTTNDTTAKWGGLGCTLHFYSTSGQLKDQPSQYGLLFNLNKGSEVHQLWLEQASGSISHRGGNSSGWNGTWRKILDSINYKSWVYTKTDVYNKTETDTQISNAIANLVDSAPGALNTLKELAAALGNDANFASSVTNSLANKFDKAGGTLTGTTYISINNSNSDAMYYASRTDLGTSIGFGIGTSSNRGIYDAKAGGWILKVDTSNNVTFSGKAATAGAADTASKFLSNATVKLTGDVTGEVKSQKDWTVDTTLANSGVTAGSYGPSTNASPKYDQTFSVPYITVDAKGRVTAASTKTITLPSDTNSHYISKNIVGSSSASTSNVAVTGNGVYLNHLEESAIKSTHKIVGSGTVKVTSDSSGNITIAGTDTNTDTKVTTVGNHYTPTANGASELTATISGTAGTYTKDKEYTVLTGVKAQRDAAGHVTGLTYTAQKIKDTDTTYTSLKNPHSLTIQKNGITVTNGTYDGSAAKTVDITVPTKVSDLTNDSGYITTYTDTKNTTGADNTNSKIFLVGSISQTTNNTAARTYSNSKCYASGGYLYSNGKAVINENATETTDGLMSKADKKKLNGIASGANNYTHPTTAGNKHIPSGGSTGQFLGWDSKGTAKWVSNPNSDTKNTAGATNNRNTKLYLAGATSQDNNPQTYSNGGCYIGTDNALYSDYSRTITGLRVTNEYGLSNTAEAGSGGNVNLSAGDGISISVEDENTIRIDCDITVSDTNVKQSSLTTSGNYPILMAYSTSPTTGTANQAYYNTGVYINPYTKNVYATGFYETSDANLKNFNSDIDIDFDKIKQLPKKYFTWKDGDQIQHIGTSAQEIQKIYPELVSDSDGTLTVDYAKLSVIALAAVDKLVDKQKEIEDRLAKLEAIVSKLTE